MPAGIFDNVMQLPPLREVIESHGLMAKKSLGQHFLLDAQLLDAIAGYAGDLTACCVFEIGPGPGGLTRALLARGAQKLFAVEKDMRCMEALASLHAAYPAQLEIVPADALKLDLTQLAPSPRKIVANLPYNVGTQLLVNWLEQIADDSGAYASLTLMFQKEVAKRITAPPGNKDYGRLSIFAQWLCDVHWHRDVPPAAFMPPPKVESSVITLVPLPQPRFPADKQVLKQVTAAAFNQRRKMLRASLKSLGVDSIALLEAAGIDPERRAESLSVEEFCNLTQRYQAL